MFDGLILINFLVLNKMLFSKVKVCVFFYNFVGNRLAKLINEKRHLIFRH